MRLDVAGRAAAVLQEREAAGHRLLEQFLWLPIRPCQHFCVFCRRWISPQAGWLALTHTFQAECPCYTSSAEMFRRSMRQAA